MLQQINQPPKDKKRKPNKFAFVLLLLVALSLVSLFYIFLSPKKKGVGPVPPPSPTSSPSITAPEKASSPRTDAAYFLNKIVNTKVPVTGYSWINKTLLYSTPGGIYKASSNEALLETAIQSISWSGNGFALYKTGNNWFLFNSLLKSSSGLSISGVPVISPTGDTSVSFDGSTIRLLEFSSKEVLTKQIERPVVSIKWALGGNLFAVQSERGGETSVQILDNNLEVKNSTEFSQGAKLLAISPSGESVWISKKNKLIIYNFSGNEKTVGFYEKSNLHAFWITTETAILVETYIDILGRNIDNLWKMDRAGNQQYLANSKPIVGRLNNDISLSLGAEKNMLPLVEKKSGLWLLSLVQNLAPFYSDKGTSFFPVSSKSH